MGKQRYPKEFCDEVVGQVLERGYSVEEVSERLGASTHSLRKWALAAKFTPAKKKKGAVLVN